MTADMTGFLFADKGYISRELFLRLLARRLKLITCIKNNMKNVLMIFEEKLLLHKRSLVGTVFDYLKNKFMLIHIISTLIAYQLKPSKPFASNQILHQR
ncbi:MAG: transposase [Holosporaceae bacterium]|nr:transposase [Holosporaceae bacterium]